MRSRTNKGFCRLALAGFLLAFLPGCGGSSDSEGRRFHSMGTAPPGGAFFVVGGAIAETLNQFPGENSWEFTAEATKGSQENIRRLVAGELDIALSNSSVTYFAVRGQESWEKPYPVQAVMTLAPNVAFFIAPRSSGVKTIADLRGKRVVVGPEGAGFELFVGLILKAHGMSLEDFTPIYKTQAGAVDMLADGSAAAAFLGGAIPTSSIAQACATQDIVFVQFDPQARNNLVSEYPFFNFATVPAGTYRGQEADFEGLDVGSMHLIASADADEGLVYQIAKTLYERRDEVTAKHPAGKTINPANCVRSTGTEFHPGAIRYYREIGIWPDKPSSPDSTGASD